MHPQIEAALAQARATDRLAAAVEDFTKEVKPAVDGVVGLFKAQEKFCNWIKANRLKIGLSIPLVATGVLGLSPNLAKGIGALLKLWGVQ